MADDKKQDEQPQPTFQGNPVSEGQQPTFDQAQFEREWAQQYGQYPRDQQNYLRAMMGYGPLPLTQGEKRDQYLQMITDLVGTRRNSNGQTRAKSTSMGSLAKVPGWNQLADRMRADGFDPEQLVLQRNRNIETYEKGGIASQIGSFMDRSGLGDVITYGTIGAAGAGGVTAFMPAFGAGAGVGAGGAGGSGAGAGSAGLTSGAGAGVIPGWSIPGAGAGGSTLAPGAGVAAGGGGVLSTATAPLAAGEGVVAGGGGAASSAPSWVDRIKSITDRVPSLGGQQQQQQPADSYQPPRTFTPGGPGISYPGPRPTFLSTPGTARVTPMVRAAGVPRFGRTF